MNLDRLKALIRLANNNPSEHEANLAARKVCKVLAENNFSLLNKPLYQPSKAQEDFVNKPRTWNDVKRSTEPQWRSRPPTVDSDFINEFFRRHGVHFAGFDWSKAPHVDAPEPDYEPFNWMGGNPKQKERRQELRVCTKCGFETMTYRFEEVPWICNPCHWKEKI